MDAQMEDRNQMAVLSALAQRALCLASDPLDVQAITLPARAAYFLLSPREVGGMRDVVSFVSEVLDGLIAQLSRTAQPNKVMYPGRIRGQVDWKATFKARSGPKYDPGCFVCREIKHQFDTPENQLLKSVLTHIARCLTLIPVTIRYGYCFVRTRSSLEVIRPDAALQRIEAALKRHQRNIYLQGVTIPSNITQQHLLRATTSHVEEYAEVAKVYYQYVSVVATPAREAISRIGHHTVIMPDQLSEDSGPWIELGAWLLKNS